MYSSFSSERHRGGRLGREAFSLAFVLRGGAPVVLGKLGMAAIGQPFSNGDVLQGEPGLRFGRALTFGHGFVVSWAPRAVERFSIQRLISSARHRGNRGPRWIGASKSSRLTIL